MCDEFQSREAWKRHRAKHLYITRKKRERAQAAAPVNISQQVGRKGEENVVKTTVARGTLHRMNMWTLPQTIVTSPLNLMPNSPSLYVSVMTISQRTVA